MADIVNTGAAANDGSGDDLRTSFQLINQRFAAIAAGLSTDAAEVVGQIAFIQQDVNAAADAVAESAGLAMDQATAATNAALLAEAARDAATVNAAVYVSTAAGLASVADGVQFQVVSADGLTISRYRRDPGPVATLVASFPSSGGVQRVREDAGIPALIGYGDALRSMVASGTASGTTIIWRTEAAVGARMLAEIEVSAGSAGAITVFVGTPSGANVTITEKQVYTVESGFSVLRPGIAVASGQVVGVSGVAIINRRTDVSASGQVIGGKSASTIGQVVAVASSAILYGINYRLSAPDTALAVLAQQDSRISEMTADLDAVERMIYAPGSAGVTVGWVGDINAATPTGAASSAVNIVQRTAMAATGHITALRIKTAIDGDIRVRVFRAPDGLDVADAVTIVQDVVVPCVAGYNTASLYLPFEAGDYIGTQSASGVTARVGATGPSVSTGGTSSLGGFAVSGVTSQGYLIQLDTTLDESGLSVDVQHLEEKVADLQGSSGGTGKSAYLGSLVAAQWLYLGGAGQSNMAGNSGVQTTRAEYQALGFPANSSSIGDLSTASLGGFERPTYGAAAYLRESIMGAGGPSQLNAASRIVLGCNAFGGKTIDELDKGTSYYTAGISQLTAAVTAAGSNALRHLGQMWFQGEADGTDGTTRATYKTKLVQLATDYDTDTRAAFAGSYLRPTFAVQVTSSLGVAPTQAMGFEIALAQQEAAVESPLVHLVGPTYYLPYADARHLTPQSLRVVGALLARAALHHAATGGKLEPLQVVEAYADGADVVLRYNRQGLVLDTTTVPAQLQCGFAVKNASNVNQVVTVSVSGNTVRLTTSSAPGAGWTWTVGDIQAVTMLPYKGGATNLRDSAGAADQIDGQPLHNWAVLQGGAL